MDADARNYAPDLRIPLQRVERTLDFYCIMYGTRDRVVMLAGLGGIEWADRLFALGREGSEDEGHTATKYTYSPDTGNGYWFFNLGFWF